MSVEKPKKKPIIKEGLRNESNVEGSAVTFEVEVDAEPPASYKWFINNSLIEESKVSLTVM